MVIEKLLAKCKAEDIKWVQLFFAKGKQDFYKKENLKRQVCLFFFNHQLHNKKGFFIV